ncbi:sugar ABC transporter permease [Clostridium zeae]|uniref:Sugar ABC transporter permease n=1 Tax=Clostridium zeae TaxID=2759022 RepID=A0ABQ1EHU8_9CLOT|nr:ABC transporter permease subunit [Clostridium zeae]GFZ34405.1 sugar ABC transporter permease [Clostridium zeae]
MQERGTAVAINKSKNNVPFKEKFDKMKLKFKNQKQLQVMAWLGVIWMIIFSYIPMYGVVIAFKKYNITKPISEAPWVGLQYFKEFLADENFMNVMKNTLGISIFKLIVCFPLPIIFALMLNELTSIKFKKFVQTISYLPHFLSWVILGGIMMNWLSDVGILNTILTSLHIIKEPITYLGEPKYFWQISVISELWKELGWSAIIYLAAIAGVDPELYEAATTDGAGRIRKMISITLPCIKPTIALLFILAVSGLLNTNFDQIMVLKNQLNASASDVLDVYVYRMGLQQARFSYATAVGLFKSVIAFMLLWSANFVSKKMNDTSLF